MKHTAFFISDGGTLGTIVMANGFSEAIDKYLMECPEQEITKIAPCIYKIIS